MTGRTEPQQAQAFIKYVEDLKAQMEIGSKVEALQKQGIPAIAKAA
ncbi:hypothetical protein [Salinibius halmophilus]|nr:hypothetical protein [Salinibius halmophilus]